MADHKLSSDSCWDLNAIVRSCCHFSTNDTTTTATNTTTRVPLNEIATNTTIKVGDTSGSSTSSETTLSILSSLKFEEEDDRFLFPNLVQDPDNGFDELHDCFKQFYRNNNNNPISSTPIIQQQGHQRQHQQQQQQLSPLPPLSLPTMTTTTTALAAPLFVFGEPQLQNQQPPQPLRHVQPSRSSRKRKAPQKRLVCHVTEENLSSDFWAWRKYGQKPIKGSPYPRNYYRCSSSKGCGARKQVERSNTDPNVFIVSYTGDHTHPRPTHRNSLAGSSRSKFPRTQNNPVAEAEGPAPQPSAAEPMAMAAEVALAEEEKTDAGEFYEEEPGAGSADEEIDDEDLLIPNPSAAFNEDPFSGLDELHVRNSSSSGGSGGC